MTDAELDEVKLRIREAVQEFINAVEDDLESEDFSIPKKNIFLTNDSSVNVKQVTVPGDLIRSYSNQQDEFFREVSTWLIDSGNSFPENKGVDYNEIPSSSFADTAESPSKRDLNIKRHSNILFNFAGDVMNYVGDIKFEKEAFNTSFEKEIVPNYNQNSLHSYRIVVPLINFDGPRENNSDISISLDSDVEIKRKDRYHRINSIRLSTLNCETVDALKTFEYNHRQRNPSELLYSGQWAIHAKVNSSTDLASFQHQRMGEPGEQLGKRIVTALRLFGPANGSVGFERSFEICSGWQKCRFGIPEVIDLDEGSREPPLKNDIFTLSEEDEEDFKNFWNDYGNEIQLNPDYELSTSLRRFNEMYVKPYPGDKLLDCIIACEGLLLFGPSPGTKKSRMSLRAGLLLEDMDGIDRQETRDQIKTAYEHRGKLVHENKYLTDILNADTDSDSQTFNHPEDYITQLRELLANVILAYIRAKSIGHSVSEVNNMLDNALREAPFNLSETGENAN